MLGLLPGLRVSCSRRATSVVDLSLASGGLQARVLGLHGELATFLGRSTQGAVAPSCSLGLGVGLAAVIMGDMLGKAVPMQDPLASPCFVPACTHGGWTSCSHSPPPAHDMVVMGSLLSAGGRAVMESLITLCSIICFADLGNRDLPSTSSSCMH